MIMLRMEEIEEAAQQLMPQATLRAHAMLYKEDTWYREEIDRAANLFIRTYLTEDLFNGESRWDLLTDITKIIKQDNRRKEMNAVRPRTTWPTTTTTTTTTTPTMTQKPQKRTRRTPIGPLALLGVGLGSAAVRQQTMLSHPLSLETLHSLGEEKQWEVFSASKLQERMTSKLMND
jgi:hypothetical protein